ncbi:MAG: TetR/AcrR family transcriptional regulator [Cyanobacteria bacterium P01_A01_bin.84]
MIPRSEARERVLKAAEKLFVERGYEAVTVKDIAKEVGIHHASIYHHIPGGKSALYVEVMTRHMQRYREGINAAIDDTRGDLRNQLQSVASWIILNPPLNIIRLETTDFPAIGDVQANAISNLAFEATLVPIMQVLEDAQKRGEIYHNNLGHIAGAIFASIEAFHAIPDKYVDGNRQLMANELIEVFIRGIKV